MPGLILIFQCEVRIFITFSPFLSAQGYTLGSHSTCLSLPLVEGLAAPSSVVLTALSTRCLESTLFLCHHLVYYMVYIMCIWFISMKSLCFGICKFLLYWMLLPRPA